MRELFGSKLHRKLEREDVDNRASIIHEYIRDNNLSAEDAVYQIDGLFSIGNKLEFAKAWLYQEGRKAEDLMLVANATLADLDPEEVGPLGHLKLELVKAWLIKGDADVAGFELVKSLFSDEPKVSERSEATYLWLKKDERTADDYRYALRFVTKRSVPHPEVQITMGLLDQRERQGGHLNLAQAFLSKDGRTADDFVKVLPFISENGPKRFTAEAWIRKQTDEAEVAAVLELFPEHNRIELSKAFKPKKKRDLGLEEAALDSLEEGEVGAKEEKSTVPNQSPRNTATAAPLSKVNAAPQSKIGRTAG